MSACRIVAEAYYIGLPDEDRMQHKFNTECAR
jgi:hypothetical protein